MTGVCQFGDRCSSAHSTAELEEWRKCFDAWKANVESESRTKKGGESTVGGETGGEVDVSGTLGIRGIAVCGI